jgi:hypothetical protein
VCGDYEKTGVSAPGYSLLHIGVRAFAAFSDKTVDPRRDNSESIREQAAPAPSRARARHREL